MRPHRLLSVALLLCLLCTADALAQLTARVYASGFTAPVAFVQDPTNPAVQFVVEQGGHIRVVENGVVLSADFLDLSTVISCCAERGLLGLAFAPDYRDSGRFFVNFTDAVGNTVVARFHRSANPLVADAASRFDLHWGGPSGPTFIAQPYANHNGGNLEFGPDGFLYIGMGDGGSANDPENRAQDPTQLLGKMLRIDVSVPDADPTGYRVPADNPFLASGPAGTLPEIWSFGLRNPWRYSFDDPARGGTGALVIGDVGQNMWEEIDYEPAGRGGRNYGWRYREGAHDNVTTLPPAYLPLTDPVYEYDHTIGNCIIGGYVYRGTALGSAYRGRYFFADFGFGRVWSVALTIDAVTGEATVSDLVEHTAEIAGTGSLGNPTSFGVDAAGELYLVDYTGGRILKIVRPPVAPDFDGDGRSDILWHHATRGEVWIWLMNGTTVRSRNYIGTVPDTGYQIAGTGDFDGDGRADILWRHATNGQVWIWSMNGTTVMSQTYITTVDPAYQIAGIGDFDGDGKADILWRHAPNGQVWMWLMDGTTIRSQTYLGTVDVSYQIVGVGDFDGDGKADVLWRHVTDGQVWIWPMNGTTVLQQTYVDTVDPGYQIVGTGDYDGDGKADILWHHAALGQVWIWLMDGIAVRSRTWIATVPEVAYQIMDPK